MKGTNLLFIILISVACALVPSQNEAPVKSPLIKDFSGFEDCYIKSDSYQHVEKSVQGKILFQFSTGTEGEVYNDIITHSDFKEVALNNCLIKELRSIRFLNKMNEENLTQTIKFIQVKK